MTQEIVSSIMIGLVGIVSLLVMFYDKRKLDDEDVLILLKRTVDMADKQSARISELETELEYCKKTINKLRKKVESVENN